MAAIKNNINRYDEPIRNHNSMGIRARLFIGFSLVVLVFLIALGTTLSVLSSTKQFSAQVINVELPLYDKFRDLGNQLMRAQLAIRGWLLLGDPKFKTEFNVAWSNIDRIQSSIENFATNWTNPEMISNWSQLKSRLLPLRDIQRQAENINTTQTEAIKPIVAKINETTANALSVLGGTVDSTGERSGGIYGLQYHKLYSGTQRILQDMNLVNRLGYFFGTIGILLAMIVALITSHNILRHINLFRLYSSKIASGDLREHLDIEGNDEMGQLGHDLNTMTESLAFITREITQACHQMVTTLDEVKQAVDIQSSGATQQASSINQITVSIEEIEKSSAQTMDKAKVLGEVAKRTHEKGQLGLDAVEESIHGMKAVRDKVQMIAQTILDLSKQTQQVGEITTVVNNLAQQSKMLALNASIEAAKAGDAGKGFAVVASEVKNLAEQSEQSTTQVQKILEDIRHATEKAVMVTEEGTKGVDQGTGLVEQTGEIVRSLSDVIHETTMASQQIEAAVRQESVGIEQITAGMNEINQVTATFVSSANQTLEAINNLSVIAKRLKEQVDTYKI